VTPLAVNVTRARGVGDDSARDGNEDGSRVVAEMVLEALRAERVTCSWDGDVGSRLSIAPFPW